MKKYKNRILVFLILIASLISVCFIPIDASRLIPIVEQQVAEDLGVQIHTEKLILRLGPSLKIKAPVMHIMYKDGQKFGQFDNVKLYVGWVSLFKDDVKIKKLFANNLILKVNSSDKYLPELFEKINKREFNENPNIVLREYSLQYRDVNKDKRYLFKGKDADIAKIQAYENFKLKALGEFFINDKKYISYDLSIVPNIKINALNNTNADINEILKQLEQLDFHSDIIADLKLYGNINNEIKASGLINIDNISVLDPERKNPKSFIYLTFLGDKIGVLSNIYSSADKKVCLDGVINNSKKLEYDLKIKTDDIELEQLYPKLKIIADCTRFKNINDIKGKLTADFNIKGDINKIKSSGFMRISDGSIATNSININKISTDVDFSNNSVSIGNAIGYINNSPIMIKGKIDKEISLEILISKLSLKNIFPESYGVKNGVLSLVADVSGTFNNIIHKENLQIDNLNVVNNNYSLAVSGVKIDTNKENIAYVNNIVLSPKQIETLKVPTLKLYIEPEKIKIPDTNIVMPNSKIVAKAEILNYNSSEFTFNSNFNGNINSKDLNIASLANTICPIKLNINGSRTLKNIESQIKLDKANFIDEPAIINLQAKLENDNLKLDDLSLISFNGEFSNNFKNNLKGQKKIILSGSIDDVLKTSPLLKNIRIYIPQQVNITLADTIAQIKGDVFINGELKKPEIVGQITVQNLINQFLQMNASNCSIDFNKNVAVINAPSVRIADSLFSLTSVVSTDISKEFFVKSANVKSKYINTDTILMYKDAPFLKFLPIKLNDGKFYAERAVATLYGSPINMSALSTDFSLENNHLKLKNISSELYNGKAAGNLDFNISDENYASNIQARGVSAAPIFDIVALKKDSMSGIMDFDANINGNLSAKQSLNGDIKFIVHNGRMGTLGKLEHLLYAQNVIADNMLRTSLSVVTKAITLKDTGLFKFLRGDITLTGGVANINMLQSQGPLMSLFVKGQYNISNDNARLVVLGRISDEIVSGLGAFGEFSFNKLMVMLTGEENKLNIQAEDMDKLPQLPMKNTKEFRCLINGILEKPSSVLLFNWISYTQKSYRQKEVPVDNSKLPDFLNNIQY